MKNVSCLISFASLIVLISCQSEQKIATPEQIGKLERIQVIKDKNAAKAIDKLHSLAVAAENNIIAEYGTGDKRDLLYISFYDNSANARIAFDTMMEKIAAAKDGPFFHLMPLPPSQNSIFFTMGMGAAHYVFISGNHVLWYQTYQSVGMELPPEITILYPADVSSVSEQI